MNRGELLTRDELPVALAEFGIHYQDRMVRRLVKAIDIRPKTTDGRQYLYDPMSVWILAAVALRSKRSIGQLDRELDKYRTLAVESRSFTNAAYVPGFTEDSEFAAQLLLLAGPDFGMAPNDLLGLVRGNPDLLEYSLLGRDFMFNVLRSYKYAYGKWLLSEPLIVEFPHEPLSPEDLRRTFASDFIEWLGEPYVPCDLDGYEEQRLQDERSGIW